MKIEVRNIDTKQYLRTISPEEFLIMCGNDNCMFDDYIKLLRKHPCRKAFNEIWEIID